jgi:anaerobic selenocysteine-containing dehydrogenase
MIISDSKEELKGRERRALCGVCPAGCWIVVTYDDEGRLADVRPDEGENLGIMCKLGEHSSEIVYSKDRLLYPLKRKGEKGTYDFERISWDDAYSIIVDTLHSIRKKHGPEALAIYSGRGSFDRALCDICRPRDVAVSSAVSILFPFGSPHTMGVGSLCYVSYAMIAPHVTMGRMFINSFSDLENADLIIVWGANPATDSPPLRLRQIEKACKGGARVVVIDPRRNGTARAVNAEWIPIRPGTDGALALGLCNVLINENLYDKDFANDWTVGFNEFSQYVNTFTPERVETITRVPADIIRSLARRIAAAEGAAPVMYTGLEYSDSGVQSIRATMVLWALAGQLDVPGGHCFTMQGNIFPLNEEDLVANPDISNTLSHDKFPIYSLYRKESHALCFPDAVLNGRPYHMKSLIILGASLMTSWPQPSIWKKALQGLDFLVCIDRQYTADSAYADIVLPATSLYEIQSYMTYGPIFRIREKVIDPPGETRSDYLILAELAKRLGYGHLYPQDEEALLRHILKGSGFSLEEVRAQGGTIKVPGVKMEYKKWEKGLLRSDGKRGFDTPTGKFEIASTILSKYGYDPLPIYTEPREGPMANPEIAERYPLVFNSGARVSTDFRSQHHGIEELCRQRPDPTVTLNTVDARKRHVNNGDIVCVRTERGEVTMRALVTDDIMQGVIEANMGGGGPVGPQAWQQCNINELTNLDHYDPISGFPVYKALLCDVIKVANGDGEASPAIE